MKNKAKLKLAGVLLGAALSSTGAYAGNGACGAGKCGGGEAKKMERKVLAELENVVLMMR